MSRTPYAEATPSTRTRSEQQSELQDILQDLLPQSRPDDAVGDASLLDVLDGFDIVRIASLSTPQDRDGAAPAIKRAYRGVLSAAAAAGYGVVTSVVGTSGRVDVYVGLAPPFGTTAALADAQRQVLLGALPGIRTAPADSAALHPHKHVAVASGIPTLRTDGADPFPWDAVARALGDQSFTAAIISRPVHPDDLYLQHAALQVLRERSHALARIQAAEQHGSQTGESVGVSEAEGESEARTRSTTVSRSSTSATAKTIGVGLSFILGVNASRSVTNSITSGVSTSDATTNGWSRTLTTSVQRSRSESASQTATRSQLNAAAAELERIAERYEARLIRGTSVGYWEISIALSAPTVAALHALEGSIRAAFAEPSDLPLPLTVRSGLDAATALPATLNGGEGALGPFPSARSSCITSEELAFIAAPPVHPLPGYEVRSAPRLGLADPSEDGGAALGKVADYGRAVAAVPFRLSPADLARHVFVCGATGSGKTTSVKRLLQDADVPYLVVECAKRDYRTLRASNDSVRVYTVGDASIAPLSLNPFYVLPGVSAQVHLDLLKALFNAAFGLYGPMPFVLEQALTRAYESYGWDLASGTHPFFLDADGRFDRTAYDVPEHRYLFPVLSDVLGEARALLDASDYSAELKGNIQAAIVTRLETLSQGNKGVLFNTRTPPDLDGPQGLLSVPTVLELEPLADDDDKAFVAGLVLALLSEYRQVQGARDSLCHLLVLDEAHRLLTNVPAGRSFEAVSNPRGRAVEVFTNALAELRGYGQGVIVSEQIPSKIALDVVKNANAHVVHRLVGRDDQTLLASALCLSDEEVRFLSQLAPGQAVCAKVGMARPVEVHVDRSGLATARPSDEVVRLHVTPPRPVRRPPYAARSVGIRFLASLLAAPPATAPDVVAAAKAELDNAGPVLAPEEVLLELVVPLLLRGPFGVGRARAAGVEEVLKGVLSRNRALDAREIQTRLSHGLGVSTSQDAVSRIVGVLAARSALNGHRRRPTSDELKAEVDAYFLSPVQPPPETFQHALSTLAAI